ncbi:MAG TPA: hypothetical protein VFA10_21110 [Ktedonobacteraceae bacterium]|nr:hypothetical protein [Ktedonobacteraceae bacterium]
MILTIVAELPTREVSLSSARKSSGPSQRLFVALGDRAERAGKLAECWGQMLG